MKQVRARSWKLLLIGETAAALALFLGCAEEHAATPGPHRTVPSDTSGDAGDVDGANASSDGGQPGSTSKDGGPTPVVDAGPQPCPQGLGDRWTCSGTSRIRCAEGKLLEEACASGCKKGAADEAVCSCGEHTGYTRWNCTPEGNRASCAGGIAWVVDSCEGKGCTAGPDGRSDTCGGGGALQDAIGKLGGSCGSGLRCAVAVRDLVSGARGAYQDTALFVSASSGKALWVGAALHDRAIADVEPHVGPIFKDSDNIETGNVIDLLASPDRINTFQWQDGALADIGFCQWNYGGTRNAGNCPGVMNGENFFSARDAVSYLSQIWDSSLLGAEKSKALLSWMKLSPRQGYGGWLGTQLPSAARASMHHKAGWRPPGAIAGYDNSNANEIGIVEVPNGHPYAVAILIDGDVSSQTYDGEALPLLEYLSCRVYHAVVGDDASTCTAP